MDKDKQQLLLLLSAGALVGSFLSTLYLNLRLSRLHRAVTGGREEDEECDPDPATEPTCDDPDCSCQHHTGFDQYYCNTGEYSDPEVAEGGTRDWWSPGESGSPQESDNSRNYEVVGAGFQPEFTNEYDNERVRIPRMKIRGHIHFRRSRSRYYDNDSRDVRKRYVVVNYAENDDFRYSENNFRARDVEYCADSGARRSQNGASYSENEARRCAKPAYSRQSCQAKLSGTVNGTPKHKSTVTESHSSSRQQGFFHSSDAELVDAGLTPAKQNDERDVRRNTSEKNVTKRDGFNDSVTRLHESLTRLSDAGKEEVLDRWSSEFPQPRDQGRDSFGEQGRNGRRKSSGATHLPAISTGNLNASSSASLNLRPPSILSAKHLRSPHRPDADSLAQRPIAEEGDGLPSKRVGVDSRTSAGEARGSRATQRATDAHLRTVSHTRVSEAGHQRHGAPARLMSETRGSKASQHGAGPRSSSMSEINESGASDARSRSLSRRGADMVEVYKEVDRLYMLDGEEDKIKGQRILVNKLKEVPWLNDDAEFTWRLARAKFHHSELEGDRGRKARQKELMLECRDIAHRAVNLCKNSNAEVHKWFAIAVIKAAEHEDIRKKVSAAAEFKKHAEISLKLNSKDAVVYHMLGRWYYELCKLSWFEKKIASAIISGLSSFTVDDAIKYFKKSEELQPGTFKDNLLLLAKCYLDKNDKTSAVKYLKLAKSVPMKNRKSEAAHKEVLELLQKHT